MAVQWSKAIILGLLFMILLVHVSSGVPRKKRDTGLSPEVKRGATGSVNTFDSISWIDADPAKGTTGGDRKKRALPKDTTGVVSKVGSMEVVRRKRASPKDTTGVVSKVGSLDVIRKKRASPQDFNEVISAVGADRVVRKKRAPGNRFNDI